MERSAHSGHALDHVRLCGDCRTCRSTWPLKTAQKRSQGHLPFSLGKLHNTFLGCKAQWEAMRSLANNLNFKPAGLTSADILAYTTNVSDLARETVSSAMEIVGGQSFYKKHLLERLFRDVQASQFHPLPKWSQYEFTSRTNPGKP